MKQNKQFYNFLAILLAFISLGYFEEKPQYNAYIERFNGILKKEFINHHHLSLDFQNLEKFLIINFFIIFSVIIIQEISYYSLNFKSPLQYKI